MKSLNVVALVILIVGGLNWGLIGVFDFDLVAAIFGGEDATFSRIIYAIVGLCALYCIGLVRPAARAGERADHAHAHAH